MAPEPKSRRPDLRYEVKTVCAESAVDLVRIELDLCPAGLRPLYAPRRVQSVYLDTHEGHALDENLAGVSHREKLRFRWYGDEAVGARGTLEKKVRSNALGWKELLPIPEPIDVEGIDRREFVEALRAHAPSGWIEDLQGLGPAQWIAYSREYLQTADRRVRVTIDRNLRTCDQRFLPRLSRRFSTPLPRIAIIEFKAAEEHYADVRDLISRFELVPDRCSKFVMASAPEHAPVAAILEG